MTDSEWLTIPEACEMVRIRSRNTLMKRIRNGDIYGTKKFGRWLIKRKSVEQYLNEDDLFVDFMARWRIKCDL